MESETRLLMEDILSVYQPGMLLRCEVWANNRWDYYLWQGWGW